MSAKATIPLTQRALIQRVNRALKKRNEMLKAARGANAQITVGDYYIVDIVRNFVVAQHIDLEHLGKELGVMQPYEKLVEA